MDSGFTLLVADAKPPPEADFQQSLLFKGGLFRRGFVSIPALGGVCDMTGSRVGL